MWPTHACRWSAHYRMYDYVACELPSLLKQQFPQQVGRTLGALGVM